jgi:diguanylate cyclase (GGDEF)-like protein
MIDRMTGICNRAHFLIQAESEWSRFVRYGGPLALIMMDIDRFKSINDTLGHDAGDAVITWVAAMCVEVRQPMNIVARIGGEEFAILLPETDLARGGMVAERLRARIENQPYSNGRARITTTVSIGVAQADAKMSGFSALMKRADEALYKAKRNGRNRVEIAGLAGMTADPSAFMAEAS